MSLCPYCDSDNKFARAIQATRGPQPGDLIICQDCFRWTVLTETVHLRKPNAKEIKMLSTDSRYTKVLQNAIDAHGTKH